MQTKEKVAATAAILDEIVPGWEKVVSPRTLSLVSDRDCVIGQITGHYNNRKGISLRHKINRRSQEVGYRYGALLEMFIELDALRYWRNEIRARTSGGMLGFLHRRQKKVTSLTFPKDWAEGGNNAGNVPPLGAGESAGGDAEQVEQDSPLLLV